VSGGHLRLRRGRVVEVDPLTVEIDGERRPAWVDESLLGPVEAGDEVIVNVAALDLGLGSGGFDVVHANLTRGLESPEPTRGLESPERGSHSSRVEGKSSATGAEPHVIKLNYTSLQHPVDPIEAASSRGPGEERGKPDVSELPAVVVLPLHGHLAPVVWAAAQATPGITAGYVQTGGGALPGSLSRDVAELRERGLLAGHITAGPAYGGEHEAISVPGAIDAAAGLGWDAILIGPGPGIIGSDSELGHGGMAALENAHAGLALGLPVLISPRLSSSDPRERHREVSHHTRKVLQMLLAPVEVAAPTGEHIPIAILATACGWKHKLREAPADLDGYAASGLPTRTMGRGIEEDPLFFAAPLAAGGCLRRKG
jgi:hypothetical protein